MTEKYSNQDQHKNKQTKKTQFTGRVQDQNGEDRGEFGNLKTEQKKWYHWATEQRPIKGTVLCSIITSSRWVRIKNQTDNMCITYLLKPYSQQAIPLRISRAPGMLYQERQCYKKSPTGTSAQLLETSVGSKAWLLKVWAPSRHLLL